MGVALMPKFLEDILKRTAAKKGFTGKRAARYVFGAMNDIGAMRGNKETAKGAAMDVKHARDQAAGRIRPPKFPQGNPIVKQQKTPRERSVFAYDWKQHQGQQ